MRKCRGSAHEKDAEYQRAYYEKRKANQQRAIDALSVALHHYDAFKDGLLRIDRVAPRNMCLMETIADILRDTVIDDLTAEEIARKRGLTVEDVQAVLKSPATEVRRRHVYGRWTECHPTRLVEDARVLWEAGATVDLIARTLSSFYAVTPCVVRAWLFGFEDDYEGVDVES